MESIANAAMRRGGSALRDAFIEALVESKCMSTDALRHAASVSNFEGSLDAVSSIESSIMQQQLATAKQNEHWSVHAGADSVEALARVDAISVMEEKLFESSVQLTVQEKELRELRRLLSERQVSEATHRQNKQKSR